MCIVRGSLRTSKRCQRQNKGDPKSAHPGSAEEKNFENCPVWTGHLNPRNVTTYPIMGQFAFSHYFQFSSVQSLGHVWLFVTPWTVVCQASLSITNSQSLLKLMCMESLMPSNHLFLCRPLLLTSVFPSIRVFSSESVHGIRWPKYWSFSFSMSPFNEYSGLISFGIDWFNLLAVQGILKSLFWHHSSKLQKEHHQFFDSQLSL